MEKEEEEEKKEEEEKVLVVVVEVVRVRWILHSRQTLLLLNLQLALSLPPLTYKANWLFRRQE